MQPVRIVLFLAEPQGPFQEPGGHLLRVLGLQVGLVVGGLRRGPPGTPRTPRGRSRARLLPYRLRGRPGGRRLGPANRRDAGKGVIGHEFVARRGKCSAGRSRDTDTHDIPAQAPAPLGQGDVVRVPGHDHHVGQVGQAEHVLHRVHGQPDVGTVLGVGGRGKQLHQVHGAADQLPAVVGVHRGRPVRVGTREHEGAEG